MNRKNAVRKLAKLEAAWKQYEDWLRTGKNPPAGFAGVTEPQREALYKQTLKYYARLRGEKEVEPGQEQVRFRLEGLLAG